MCMIGISMEKQFLEAYEKYADAIFRHCYFRLSDEEQARDIMQETFLKTWEYIAQGKEIKNIRAFLYRVAHNQIVDHYRKKKESSLEGLQEKGFEPRHDIRENLMDTVDAKSVVETIEKLDEKYRDTILMRYVDELSVQEIAEILGESENLVSVHIHRGIQQLRKLLHYGE